MELCCDSIYEIFAFDSYIWAKLWPLGNAIQQHSDLILN